MEYTKQRDGTRVLTLALTELRAGSKGPQRPDALVSKHILLPLIPSEQMVKAKCSEIGLAREVRAKEESHEG